jgi:asparaginyl-tRNA synthetase
LTSTSNDSLLVKILSSDRPLESVTVRGWVRTRRDAKGFSFVELNDGSTLKNLQIILDADTRGLLDPGDVQTGAALEVEGALSPSPGKGQRWELRAREAKILGKAEPGYPLQKKRHTDEFLRGIAHLRPRTNKYGALFRVRSETAYALHAFFRERSFFYLHSPVITGSDAEGAGELFRVGAAGDDPATGGFFGKPASLTVSGQLEAELFALALGRVYTFGPAFRAERSNTARHAAEFWMAEPEAAFFDLDMTMDLAEELVKHLVRWAMDESRDDLELFERFLEKGLFSRLEDLCGRAYERIPYFEAVRLLKESGRIFEHPPEHGSDIQTEHERFLTESYFKGPVFVYDYPAEIKPFYMRLSDDETTVRAMDLLVPRVGEIVGGSQREERLDKLLGRMDALGLSPESYWWYLDSRRYGGAPHSGFGLGFERLLMLITGIGNIRDVLPFPRTPGNLEF